MTRIAPFPSSSVEAAQDCTWDSFAHVVACRDGIIQFSDYLIGHSIIAWKLPFWTDVSSKQHCLTTENISFATKAKRPLPDSSNQPRPIKHQDRQRSLRVTSDISTNV